MLYIIKYFIITHLNYTLVVIVWCTKHQPQTQFKCVFASQMYQIGVLFCFLIRRGCQIKEYPEKVKKTYTSYPVLGVQSIVFVFSISQAYLCNSSALRQFHQGMLSMAPFPRTNCPFNICGWGGQLILLLKSPSVA